MIIDRLLLILLPEMKTWPAGEIAKSKLTLNTCPKVVFLNGSLSALQVIPLAEVITA